MGIETKNFFLLLLFKSITLKKFSLIRHGFKDGDVTVPVSMLVICSLFGACCLGGELEVCNDITLR
jgi:hypothetical protein